jgi:hypothetical protein
MVETASRYAGQLKIYSTSGSEQPTRGGPINCGMGDGPTIYNRKKQLVTKSKEGRGHVAHMAKTKNAYKIFDQKTSREEITRMTDK